MGVRTRAGSYPPFTWSSDELHGLDDTPWHDLSGRQLEDAANVLSGKYLFSEFQSFFQ